MKIINKFTDKTIELEHSRNPSTMSIDDLYWCFETEIRFYESDIAPPVLTIDEASFFFFLAEFKGLVESISNEKPGEYTINDQEGSFTLVFTSDGETVTVKKLYPFQSFEIPLKEFLKAAHIWMREAKKNTESLFPDLSENPDYKNLEI
jgi:hypothetical protein